MLEQRINLLFPKRTWRHLRAYAKRTKRSASDLIREAVEEKYFPSVSLEQRKKAIQAILKHRPHLKGKVDYKSWVEEGRDYEGRGY